MNPLPSAIDAAKKLIEDYPYLFNQDEKYKTILQTAIAMAILQYSIDCDKAERDFGNNLFEKMGEFTKEYAKKEYGIDIDNKPKT